MSRVVALAVYITAVVGANYLTTHYGLVDTGFGLLVTAGTFAAGFALLARDFVQRAGGIRLATTAIAVAGLLSWWLAGPGIAVASTVAFVGAELVDLFVFTPLRPRLGFVSAALASNVVAAPIDTILFLHLAGFGVTAEAVGGQFVAKIVWATLIPLALYIVARRAVLRQPNG
jgi:hypothetical protein